MSASVAVLVIVSRVLAAMVRLVCAGNVGAEFTSFTTTVKLLVALNGGTPLSTTRVVMVLVEGPWASVGVHVMTPPLVMLAPVGGLSKLCVSLLAGISDSV